MRLRSSVIASCTACLIACQSSAPARSGRPDPERAARTSEGERKTDVDRPRDTPAAPLPAATQNFRVHYALAPELARAELRRGDALLFDFGEPGESKYDLGGWATRSADRVSERDKRALVVRSKSAKLFLPADSNASARLYLRILGSSGTTITLLVDGERVGERTLDGDAFETLEFEILRPTLRATDNLIELRSSRSGFALDYAILTPITAADGDVAPPDGATLSPKPDLLRVPDGISLGYTLDVPAGAELHASAQSDAPARLRVSAARDAKARVELAAIELGGGAAQTQVRVPLASLKGDLARIELTASGGTISLEKPAIVEPQRSREVSPKPLRNVLILLIDTLRADKLAPYNPNTRVRTPGLLRFLESAATMHDARTQENWTKPSVATLLSSLYPWQHNAFDGDSRVPESVELLPEYFSARGFRTAAFIANGYVSDKFGFGQGWDDYRNYIRENRRSIAQEVAGDVLDWLDRRPKDKPFFLYVHTIDPHVPYRPPKSFLAMYDPDPYDGPVDFSRNNLLLEHIKLGKLPLENRDKVRLQALYDAEITYHDVHFAAIFDGLAKRGLRDETLVVITADHGEEFWEHGSVGHGHSVYDELLRIPLILRIPGVTEDNLVVQGDVGLVDVAPTILEAMKLPVPDGMAGRSFLPELIGAGLRAPRATASGFMTKFRTLAVGRWKLVQRGLEAELYDLDTDPTETTDLSEARPMALRYTRGLLGLQLAQSGQTKAVRKRQHKRETTTIDAETEAQLRALGYVGTAGP